MKVLLSILALILVSSPCLAWDKEDTAMQAAVVSLFLADMSQTLYISEHGNEYRELNPILGEHPNKDKVYTYFIAGAIIHTAISYLIEKVPFIENPKLVRRIWQGSFIVVESGVVTRNKLIGIGFSY
jgi:hypothetical protein